MADINIQRTKLQFVGPLISTEVRALGNGKAVAAIKLELIVEEGAQLSTQDALALLDYAREKVAAHHLGLYFDWNDSHPKKQADPAQG